jgi:hypothetical protein
VEYNDEALINYHNKYNMISILHRMAKISHKNRLQRLTAKNPISAQFDDTTSATCGHPAKNR